MFDSFQVFEQSGSPCLMTSESGRIIYVNPALARLTGYSRARLLGANPRLFASGHTPEELYKDLWSTISEGNSWRGEILNKKRTGEKYWESITISPVVDKKKGEVRYFAFLEDRTEERRKADQRARLLDTIQNFLNRKQEERVVPICSNCHSIRHSNEEWQDISTFLDGLTGGRCTHGMCPGCIHELYPDLNIDLSQPNSKKDSK